MSRFIFISGLSRPRSTAHRLLWVVLTGISGLLVAICLLTTLVGGAFVGSDLEAGGTTYLQLAIWLCIDCLFIASFLYSQSHLRSKQ